MLKIIYGDKTYTLPFGFTPKSGGDDVDDLIVIKKDVAQTHNIHIYPEDKMYEIKEKISIISGIPVFKQCVVSASSSSSTLEMMKYEILLRGIPVNPGKPVQGQRNMRLINDQANITIRGYDHSYTFADMYMSGITELEMFNADDFISSEVITMGEQELNDFYWGFIVMYWPMLTYESFRSYIKSASEFREVFPDYYQVPDYQRQDAILLEKYQLLDTPEMQKYNPHLSIAEFKNNKLVSISINAATVSNKPKSTANIMNVRTVFNEMQCSRQNPLIRCNVMIKNKLVSITRIHADDASQATIVANRDAVNISNFGTVVFLFISPESQIASFVFVLYAFGKYNIKIGIKPGSVIGLPEMLTATQKFMNAEIERINDKNRAIFLSFERIMLVNPGDCFFSSISITIKWLKTITLDRYKKFISLIGRYAQAGIVRRESEEVMPGLPYTIYFLKSGVDVEWDDYYKAYTNYYEYLCSVRAKQRWQKLCSGKQIDFTHNINDVAILIHNCRESEFRYIYSFLCMLFHEFDGIGAVDESTVYTEGTSKGLTKSDPVLYDLKKYGITDVVSRLCQKQNRPMMYSKSEYEKLSEKDRRKFTEYWNFTTNEPAYYTCPNPKFPFVNFISGVNPLGLCIPCCKITNLADPNITIKKKKLHEACMARMEEYKRGNIQFEPKSEEEEDDFGDRYIKNYSQILDVGRISRLPPAIDKYVNYHIKTIVREYVNIGDDLYSVYLLQRAVKSNKGYFINREHFHSLIDGIDPRNLDYKIHSVSGTLTEAGADPRKMAQIMKQQRDPDIIIYESSGIHVLCGGINIIQQILQNVNKIEVKFITTNQLRKCLVEDPAKLSKQPNTRRKGFYILGIDQGYRGVANAGLFNVIYTCFRKTPEELLDETIRKNKNWSIFSKYFASAAAMSDAILNFGKSGFDLYDWDEIWSRILIHYYDVGLIILQDNNDNSDDEYNFNIIVNKRDTDTYIIAVRSSSSVNLRGNKSYSYNPVCIITPKIFFKTMEMDETMFSSENKLVKLLLGTLKHSGISDNITYKDVSQAIGLGYAISGGYANNKRETYAVSLSKGNHRIYVPISPEFVHGLPASKDIEVSGYKYLADFLRELQIAIKRRINISTAIIHDDKIIALKVVDAYAYIIPISERSLRDVYSYIKDCDLTILDETQFLGSVIRMKYHPNDINAIIRDDKTNFLIEKYQSRIDNAIQSKTKYFQMYIDFLSELDRDRNPIRKKLYANLDTWDSEVTAEIGDEASAIRDKIAALRMKHMSDAEIILILEASEFEFDKTRLRQIRKLESKEEIRDFLSHMIPDETFLKIMVEQIANPLTREAIFSGLFIRQVHDYIYATKKINDMLYIKVIE